MKRRPPRITRRTFVAGSAGALIAAAVLPADAAAAAETRQAMGTRVGDVTDSTAVVWTRVTAAAARNLEGKRIPGRAADYKGKALPEPIVPPEELEGACPGAPGRVRLSYGTKADGSDARQTDWVDVGPASDFIHQFKLEGLSAATTYRYESETADPEGRTQGVFRGEFQTAPAAGASGPLSFCVMTCQGYPDRGHPDGHPIYPSMLALKPSFACLTGDLVYYDNDLPRATSPRLARYHWERMFSLPRLVDFNRSVSTYWLKDDHDTLSDDSWPGKTMGTLTFEEGQRIFRQQAPKSEGPSYRTFRWGRDLQIWLTDGRDFRSPNRMPDGPEKTIWGREQKEWFRRTVKSSDATWKVLISPTPLVGPDRRGKNDNHANAGFQHEGDELRGWLQENAAENLLVVCGDRHWQYHSVHPKTGLNEFSVGAASDEHAGGSPGLNPAIHRFHRVKGGFLSVSLRSGGGKSTILFQHRDVHGAVVYEWSRERSV